jgi:hypothetical protein
MTPRLQVALAAVALTAATASAQVRRPVVLPQTTVRPPQFVPPGNPLLPFQGPLVPGQIGRVVDPFSGVVTDIRTASNPWTGVTRTDTATIDPFSGRTERRTVVNNPNVGRLTDTLRTDPWLGAAWRDTRLQPTPNSNVVFPVAPFVGR